MRIKLRWQLTPVDDEHVESPRARSSSLSLFRRAVGEEELGNMVEDSKLWLVELARSRVLIGL